MKTNEKDPVGIRVISNAMKKNKGLKVLNLSGNNMSNRGATFISEMLQENKTLVSLSCDIFSYNYCLLYKSDAAEEEDSVALGCRRII